MKILIVEDDYNTLNGLIELLNLDGHSVAGAHTAKIAWEMVNKHTFDLVLCDFRLPDTNGMALCDKINRQFQDTKLFMFTAYCNMQHREQAKNCGISRLFNKPLDLDELFQALDSVHAQGPARMLN